MRRRRANRRPIRPRRVREVEPCETWVALAALIGVRAKRVVDAELDAAAVVACLEHEAAEDPDAASADRLDRARAVADYLAALAYG